MYALLNGPDGAAPLPLRGLEYTPSTASQYAVVASMASESPSGVAPVDTTIDVQTPPVHAVPPQEWPHAPQLLGSDVVSTHPAPQHVLLHEVALQVQAPPLQTCPVTHAAPPPHAQPPEALQRSEWVSHVPHAAPPLPHDGHTGVPRHVAPEQQPEAQDAGSQAQPAAVQCCPAAQVWPLFFAQPHPLPVHSSLRTASHPRHAAPLIPQVGNADVTQVVPLQHPVHPLVASQVHLPDAQR